MDVRRHSPHRGPLSSRRWLRVLITTIILAVGGGSVGCDQLNELMGEDKDIEKDDDSKKKKKKKKKDDDDKDDNDSKKKKKKKKDDDDDKDDNEDDDGKDDNEDDDASASVDLGGTYDIITSSNPGGSAPYRGTVTLEKDGGAYTIAWKITNTPPYRGVAIHLGNRLGVGWGMGAQYGVAVYEIKNGDLVGRWVTPDDAKVGRETVKGGGSLNGTFDVSGKDGSGGKYKGEVVIKRNGAGYDIKYTLKGVERARGVGLKNGDSFVVGWGSENSAGGVVSYLVDDDTLIGQWTSPGVPALGSETLKKQ